MLRFDSISQPMYFIFLLAADARNGAWHRRSLARGNARLLSRVLDYRVLVDSCLDAVKNAEYG